MKRVLFINSHIGSGAERLMLALSKSPRIQKFKGLAPFSHPEDLNKLTNKRHKCDNSAAIYMHGLWNNTEWVRYPCRKVSHFIHIISEPRNALSKYQKLNPKLKPSYILQGYCQRLKGIYELSKITPDSLIFDMDKIDLSLIKRKLALPTELDLIIEEKEDNFPEDLCKIAERTYEGYFKLLNL